MITNTVARDVTTNTTSTQSFTIKANGKAFRALIDGLYENKIQSIVREIWSNALDSHNAAGTPERSFSVSFPSLFNPTFVVRDFGTSLSHEDIMHLYTTVFESTKEDTNDAVGKFGLGSKSPFAYTDTFSVTAFMNGEKRFYSAVIAEDGIPQIHFMGQEDTDEANGIEVSFPIESRDIDAFRTAAMRVSHGFDVKPTVVAVDENEPEFEGWPELPVLAEGEGWALLHGYIEGYSSRAYARMGCVLYPINVNAIPDLEPTERRVLESSMVIEFEMGELEINVSRETLSYGSKEPTADSIRRRVRQIVSEMVQSFMGQYEQCATYWEACMLYAEHMDTDVTQMPSVVRETLEKEAQYNGEKLVKSMWVGDKASHAVNIRQCRTELNSITGDKLRNLSYRFNYYTDGVEIRASKDTVIYVEDLSLTKKEKLVASRIRAHAQDNKVSQVIWMKYKDSKQDVGTISTLFAALDGANIVDVADLEVPPKESRTGAPRRPVQVRLSSGRGFDTRIDIAPEEFENGGFVVPLERMNPQIPSMCANPRDVFNALKAVGAVPQDADLYGIPKSLWKKFDGAQWVNLYDFAKEHYATLDVEEQIKTSRTIAHVLRDSDLRFLIDNVKLDEIEPGGPISDAIDFYNGYKSMEKPAVEGAIQLARVLGHHNLTAHVAEDVETTLADHNKAVDEAYPLMEHFRDDCRWVSKLVDKVTHYVQVCDKAAETTNQSAAVAA